MSKRDRRKVIAILAAAILTTEGGDAGAGASGGDAGTGGGDQNAGDQAGDAGNTGDQAGDQGGDQSGGDQSSADDLSTLFSMEEIQARKDETARRAALTDEERTAEDAAKAAAGVPEKYEFKAPEGMSLDPEVTPKFEELARARGLSQESAQEFVNLGLELVEKTIGGMVAQHEAKKATWLQEAMDDPEIGADVKLYDPANPESAKNSVSVRALNTLMGQIPGLKDLINDTGIGNHKDFIRIFHRLGKNMREDTFVIPSAGGGAKPTSRADALWPD